MSGAEGTALAEKSAARNAERVRLLAQPSAVVVIVGAVLVWAFARDNDEIEAESIRAGVLLTKTWEHLLITAVVTVIVVGVAVPLGAVLTRRWAKPVAPVFLGIANIGQAAPALGVLVLFFLWTGWDGLWAAALPIAFYSLLPVLRNTIVGIQSVDPALVDAARGIGMSQGSVLLRVEMPLALPMVLAGMRTSLVLAVGTATLAFFVNGGGLGELVDTGYKLNRPAVLVVGAVLSVGLALLVDWLGALAEQLLGPKGLG